MAEVLHQCRNTNEFQQFYVESKKGHKIRIS